MLKTLLKASLTGFLILLLISCEKDPTSGANVGGTSSYSLAGSPSACSAPVIAGLYNAGMQMTTANTLTFTVNVTAKGTYSINTTTANGVWFSGAGVFPATGNQTVILYGNGTPAKQGSFAFVPVTNNTCNFSVSFGSGAPAAVFTYAGAPGNCTAPVVNGTYASGISLGAANYVDLAVNVTTPGAYTINTNSANGIGFSGSGAFTATGPQVVRLIGNGTPAAAGTNVYKPTGGCSFNITVTPPAPPATFTYNGAPGGCTAPGINGTYSAGVALNATNTVVLSVNVSVIGSYSVSTNNQNGVVFSGSGNFTTLGANTITLTSTNTATTAGTFSYTPAGGCSFDVTYTGGGGGGGYFLTCKVNNVVTNFNDALSGYLDNSPSPTFPYHFNTYGGNPGSGDMFYILLYDYNNAIAMGNTYNNGSAGNMIRFCTIQYNTAGTAYMISANPNSFSVTITGITASEITGTFSGTLYEGGVGPATKTIAAGSFKVNY